MSRPALTKAGSLTLPAPIRRIPLAVLLSLALLAGCGYVGPVLPPSAQIPPPVNDLNAIERGDKIVVTFRTPARTTDSAPIKRFNEIELRIGPTLTPFDFESWAETARRYPVTPPPASDPLDPQPIALKEAVSLEGLLGKHVAVAVRMAIKRGDHFSSWSNRVVLDVLPPLAAPAELKLTASADGIILDWQAVEAAKNYRISRQSPSDKTPVEIATAEQAHFVDATSQFDIPYTYEVVAVNGAQESLPADSQPFTAIDKFAPTVPGGLTALAGPESIELSWQRSPEADLAGYFVYRSVNGMAFTRQGEMVNLPAYSDHNVEHGKIYRYQISSVDQKKNESARSTVAEIAF